MKIIIINGPNLNLTGEREKHIYGERTFENYLEHLKSKYPHVQLEYYQSNIEGELINKLHEAGFEYDGIIINAAAYTHTSVAMGDAVAAISASCVEVHISNIFAREDFRHHSFLSKHCKGVVSGFGLESYELALLYFIMQK